MSEGEGRVCRGMIVKWLTYRGYGFAKVEGMGQDVLIHYRNVSDPPDADGKTRYRYGDLIEGEIRGGTRGHYMVDVRLANPQNRGVAS